jgi:hypothetical protein
VLCDLLYDKKSIYMSKSIEVKFVEIHEDFNALFSVSKVCTFIFNVATSPKCI